MRLASALIWMKSSVMPKGFVEAPVSIVTSLVTQRELWPASMASSIVAYEKGGLEVPLTAAIHMTDGPVGPVAPVGPVEPVGPVTPI